MAGTKIFATLMVVFLMTASCSKNETESEAEQIPQAAPTGEPESVKISSADAITFANLTGDAENGKGLFAQCRACHVVADGTNKSGPSLKGVVGREAGLSTGFKYSSALLDSGTIWTKENLDKYLENPQRSMPGTRMIFAGLKDPQDRADIIAYLEKPN